MRVAVISDIHGNAVALDAVLENIKDAAPDTVVNLGDAIQGGPQPAEVVSALRKRGWPVVMGNSDAWLLSGIETGNEIADEERRRTLNDVRDWSLSRLSEEDRAYIASFQPTVTVDLGNEQELLCFHGSPTDFDEVLLPTTPDEEFYKVFEPFGKRFFAGGHVHLQYIRHIGRTFYFNPGSVGHALRHDQEPGVNKADPWAEYALLDVRGSDVSLEFRRVAFEIEDLRSAYRSSGRPHLEAALLQLSS